MTTIDVAIATLGPEGIARVGAMQLPRVAGVRYVVSLQNSGGCPLPPQLEARDDVEVHRVDCRGVSDNRNHGFGHCTADVILIADDDLIYTPEGLEGVRRSFDTHPEIDYALFRADSPDGKPFPSTELAVGRRMPGGHYVASYEIAFRQRINRPPVRFDPRFGPGSPRAAAGDDEVFALTLRRLGLKGRYFPHTVTCHPGWSAGVRKVTDTRLVYGLGAYIGLCWPVTALPRIALKAVRMARSGQCALGLALRGMLQGWFNSLAWRRPWKLQ